MLTSTFIIGIFASIFFRFLFGAGANQPTTLGGLAKDVSLGSIIYILLLALVGTASTAGQLVLGMLAGRVLTQLALYINRK